MSTYDYNSFSGRPLEFSNYNDYLDYTPKANVLEFAEKFCIGESQLLNDLCRWIDGYTLRKFLEDEISMYDLENEFPEEFATDEEEEEEEEEEE